MGLARPDYGYEDDQYEQANSDRVRWARPSQDPGAWDPCVVIEEAPGRRICGSASGADSGLKGWVVIDDTELFNDWLHEWESFYNFNPPHGSFGRKTPY